MPRKEKENAFLSPHSAWRPIAMQPPRASPWTLGSVYSHQILSIARRGLKSGGQNVASWPQRVSGNRLSRLGQARDTEKVTVFRQTAANFRQRTHGCSNLAPKLKPKMRGFSARNFCIFGRKFSDKKFRVDCPLLLSRRHQSPGSVHPQTSL